MSCESKENMLLKLKEIKLNTLLIQTDVMKCREEISDLQLEIFELYKPAILELIADFEKILNNVDNTSTNEPMA